MNPVRTFIAVHFSELPSLRRILTALGDMGSPVRAVRGDGLHLTLKFLGDTDPRLLGEIGAVVQQVAAAVPPFEVELVGLGVFPHADRPTVVWAGFRGPGAETLCKLAEELEAELEALGFPRERRKFEPHLTLARIKSRPPRELGELLAKHKETSFGTVTVDALVHFQSDLRPEGPLYTPLATAKLGTSEV